MAKQNDTLIERKNILITGAAGFIGSNLCERLVKENNIIAVDNFSTGKQANIDLLLQNPNFEFIKHDISQPLDLEQFPELKKFQVNVSGIHTIYNLACPTSPRDHEQYAMEILVANSYGVKNMLDLALNYKSLFVQVSSQHIYGKSDSAKPIREDYLGSVDALGPRSAYDEGKRFAETMVMNYLRKFNMDCKIARLFTTYGPKMAIRDGRAVPDFIFNALNDHDLVVYGNKQTENTFCYIDDAIDGLTRLADSSLKTPVNIGHYEKVKLKDLAELIIKIAGSKSKIVYKKAEWQTVSYNIPDISLAKEKLGWFPLISLEEGLNKTIEFTKANIRLYQV
jgi:UDP-glucuronate decarboxylase